MNGVDMKIEVNGRLRDVPEDWRSDSLLSVLREPFGLVGAKFGCGVGVCGACTVLVGDEPTRACVTPVASVGARAVTTVEGLADGDRLHRVQQCWIDEAVPQCGYCQAGQVMAAVALLRRMPRPTDAQIDEALDGNLCRCGTQQRVRRAIHRAAGSAT